MSDGGHGELPAGRKKVLKTAIEAAKGAGRVIGERYSAPHKITLKGCRDLVTDVDTAAEAAILT
jgi:fructose-1,6-bisphosphatase/inositol monophosphatase family enzyme